MTNREYLNQLPNPSIENPIKILMSSCLAGTLCGYDGTANGTYPSALKLLGQANVKIILFCPEEFSFGSPREMCDIHGGTGLDVLEGKAKVLSETGIDWSEGMIKASERMLAIAQENKIDLAVMMDVSAACGSQVIYDGNRFAEDKKYQIGAGVSAAQLMRNGFQVISQRDFASLEILYKKIDPTHEVNIDAKDHHEIDWYKDYFSTT
ncbi:MAG: 2-thiouracil desulfurase family protein [Bacteroidia bacterium]|nr:2-thiouracil desulfurase family protein [Bacteroidia bacterium]MCF8425880.1 2-thiouracil desulfurase family protein [Bacteroidia bacterium]MCF8445659.1 2-thiouracil desulfurase family protein [Bacteroidia bacterium]